MFAIEIHLDGKKWRCEAPTLDEVLRLYKEAEGLSDSLGLDPDADEADKPTVLVP